MKKHILPVEDVYWFPTTKTAWGRFVASFRTPFESDNSLLEKADKELAKYNGKINHLLDDFSLSRGLELEFESEEDLIWFLLRWA